MKDFDDQYLKKYQEESFKDPNTYVTKEVKEQLRQIQRDTFTSVNIVNIIGTILTSPFQTIATSLQLSVKPHKNIYQAPQAKTKSLVNINKALTLQQKRKLQLMLRAGVQQKPYTAPIYDGYASTIKGLLQQGPKAFFKGLSFRIIHQIVKFYSYYELSIIGGSEKFNEEIGNLGNNIIKIYLFQCLADIAINFCHILQNRYILQNNIADFKVFRNVQRVISKLSQKREFFIGYKYHILNNIFMNFIHIPFYLMILGQNFSEQLSLIYYTSELIMYPFNTAFRRLLCQNTQIPGMIPVRYKSVWHGVRLIFREEKLWGLYKGFGIYQVILLTKILFGLNFGDYIKTLCSKGQ